MQAELGGLAAGYMVVPIITLNLATVVGLAFWVGTLVKRVDVLEDKTKRQEDISDGKTDSAQGQKVFIKLDVLEKRLEELIRDVRELRSDFKRQNEIERDVRDLRNELGSKQHGGD